MFGSSAISSGLSFSKIIGGITKTLGIANQVIPIYREVKPIIGNAKNMFSIIKEFRSSPSSSVNSNNNVQSIQNITQQKKSSTNSNPVFFQ